MCDRVVSENLFLILYCPDKYITQKMCDEPVDDSLATLQLIRNWFLASKIIKKLFSTLMQIKIYSILMKILVMLSRYS